MIKALVGVFTGAALTAGILLGPLSPLLTAAMSDSTTAVEDLTDNITEVEMVIGPLLAAGEKIVDPDIAAFYNKLMAAYQLEDASSWLAPSDNSTNLEIVPNIERINYIALTLPLVEAGKKIQDEDIREFYEKFLREAGLVPGAN